MIVDHFMHWRTEWGCFAYSRESKSDDIKSFYASVECVECVLRPSKTSLCVMSRTENTNRLIIASSPMFKIVFGKNSVSCSFDLPFGVKTRKFDYYVARRQGLPITLDYVRFIEGQARVIYVARSRMALISRRTRKSSILFKTTPAHMIL